MASVEASIETALFGRVATISFSPDWTPGFRAETQIAWPNVVFSPAPSGPYLRVSHLPNTVDQVSLGETGINRHVGLLQVSVVWPLNVSASPAIEAAGQIARHFKRGTTLSSAGLSIRIHRPPVVGRMIQEDTVIHVPVTVSWLCDAAN